jgi:hypothetical protein
LLGYRIRIKMSLLGYEVRSELGKSLGNGVVRNYHVYIWRFCVEKDSDLLTFGE